MFNNHSYYGRELDRYYNTYHYTYRIFDSDGWDDYITVSISARALAARNIHSGGGSDVALTLISAYSKRKLNVALNLAAYYRNIYDRAITSGLALNDLPNLKTIISKDREWLDTWYKINHYGDKYYTCLPYQLHRLNFAKSTLLTY